MKFNNIINKAWLYSVFVMATFPLLGIKATSIVIIILTLLTFISASIDWRTSFKSKNLKWILIFSSLYLYYLISSFFYPFDRTSGFVLEKKMSLFIFPIILFLVPQVIKKTKLHLVLLIFAITTICIALVTNSIILYKGLPYKYTLIADFSYSYRTYFSDLSKIHPTYISIFLAFSALIFLDFSLKIINYKWQYRLLFITCIACMIPLAAKLPLIAFLISLGFYLLVQPQIWKRIKYYFILFVTASIIGSVTIPSLKIRVAEIASSSFSPPEGFGYNSMNVRSGIWNCSLELIKENWLNGIGSGNIQNKLNNCYEKFNTNAYLEIDYNTHNEYFNILLSLGVLGLITFLILLLTLGYYALKKKEALFFSFIILITLCFSTENILDRQAGIVFFAFFSALFARVYILQDSKTCQL